MIGAMREFDVELARPPASCVDSAHVVVRHRMSMSGWIHRPRPDGDLVDEPGWRRGKVGAAYDTVIVSPSRRHPGIGELSRDLFVGQ